MSFSKQGAAVVTATALATVMFAATGCGKSSKTAPVSGTTAGAISTTTASNTTTSPTAPPTNKPMTQHEFIAAGEAICAHLNASLVAAPVRLKSQSDFKRVLPLAAAYERTEYDELSKLTPPASMGAAWRKFLAGTRRWSEDTAKLAAYVNTNNPKVPTQLGNSARATHERLTTVAKRAGYKECALL